MTRFCLSGFVGALVLALTVLPVESKRPTGQGAGKPPDRHDPHNATANLDVYPGLQATLFASEPTLTNPTNIDIDYRGRVWVCDVMNYRGHNGIRPAGDRILILEDTKGDGVMDRAKVFYQGRDVDSAMGICVLGNKLIVSCSPNVLVFTFDENDRIIKKEKLFTKTGMPQHDHSAHTFVFGPDGKLYWNFGNTGQSVHDRDGKPVRDRDGNVVVNNGRPYYDGMVFRCNPDGSDFEVLAHNFRNDYEVSVDSFGTVWQSDNDDDGNRSVRIVYVMEFGNYGYRDEVTGASWPAPRTNMEPEIPRRHWHQNDPGVVPNLLITGQGSPAGICIYEGKLLPKVFQRQMIHCDPGPSVTRSYVVKKQGAGYAVERTVNLLDGQKKDNWFRPVDPRVAPDGSLFVSDWFDPGVGGHAQQDSYRGRIFRVAPPGVKYRVPKFDFRTAAGAAEALKNPCSSVRYLAWTALHKMGKAAEPELLKLWHSPDPVYRARALWLLGKIEGRGQHYVDLAIKDADPDIRIVGLRLARQLKDVDVAGVVQKLVKDPAPEVRRECAIALRHNKSPQAPELWAELALQHDGRDRWYLEALGIGADKQWDAFLGAWLQKVGDRATKTPAGRDILWRSRAHKTPAYLAQIIGDPSQTREDLPRYFRAFDFQQPADRDPVLTRLIHTGLTGSLDRQTLVLLESVRRLKHLDLRKDPKVAAVLERTLERLKGTPSFVEMVSQLSLEKHYPELLAIAQKNSDQQAGVNAVQALLEKGQQQLFRQALEGKDPKQAFATVEALRTAADDRAAPVLLALVQNDKHDIELRRQAVRALARTHRGAKALVTLAQAGKLGEELKPAAGGALSTVPWRDIRGQVARLFPLPPTKDNRPLPPLSVLARMRGNPAKGKVVFRTTGTCITCHTVNGEGKDVGPNLSEIGKKLSREALLESILFPSAAIAHNYETHVVELKNGGVQTGLLVSDTAEGVTIKGADGIVRKVKRADIEQVAKSPVSLMPADLHKALTAQDLTDLVEYLLTLKEAKKEAATKK